MDENSEVLRDDQVRGFRTLIDERCGSMIELARRIATSRLERHDSLRGRRTSVKVVNIKRTLTSVLSLNHELRTPMTAGLRGEIGSVLGFKTNGELNDQVNSVMSSATLSDSTCAALVKGAYPVVFCNSSLNEMKLFAERSLVVATETKDPYCAAAGNTLMAVVLHWHARVRKAAEYYSDGRRALREMKSKTPDRAALLVLIDAAEAWRLSDLGRFEEASIEFDRLRSNVNLSKLAENSLGRLTSLYLLEGAAYAYVRQIPPRHNEASDCYHSMLRLLGGEKAAAQLTGEDAKYFHHQIIRGFGYIASSRQDSAAVDYYKKAIKSADDAGQSRKSAISLAAWGRFERDQGDPEPGLHKLQTASLITKESQFFGQYAHIELEVCRTLAQLGQRSDAQDKLRELVHFCTSLDLPSIRAEAMRLLIHIKVGQINK